MINVHMIGNAHLDPVWLWRKQAGIGEALATCRTAVELLAEYPQFVFTRSDMWVYEKIEELDPSLFDDIREYVEQGRWSIPGGWYIQPDCNLPTAESFRRHMNMGKRYFGGKFNLDVTVGYNVDSFGHAGTLPRLLQEGGYDSYVMMRPKPEEMELPASLFLWQDGEGAEVLAWRIVGRYNATIEGLERHVEACVDAATPGIDHVMCFYGVGDHGGGPTRKQIEWIIENQKKFSGAELTFSSPHRFFEAVEPFRDRLPLVVGELQYHAIGCYSVTRNIKTAVRRAEQMLHQSESAVAMFPDLMMPSTGRRIEEAWKKVLFNQFHDILAGTSLAQAYSESRDELGSAADTARDILHELLFKRLSALPDDRLQRIVCFNPSDSSFKGYLIHEPWVRSDLEIFELRNEGDHIIPHQLIEHPDVVKGRRMLLWPVEMEAHSESVFRLHALSTDEKDVSDIELDGSGFRNAAWRVHPGRGSRLVEIASDEGNTIFSPDGLRLAVKEDKTDTWSHGVSGYYGDEKGSFAFESASLEESGPLRASLRVEAGYGGSHAVMWVRLYNRSPDIDLELYLDWREKLSVLKLCLPFSLSEPPAHRVDGVPGGRAQRKQDSREYPMMDWTELYDGRSGFSVAAPDCTSLDGSEGELRLTLCRSPVYAWHDPFQLKDGAYYRFTDQGEHRFRFTIRQDSHTIAARALAYHRPPICLDWTAGMKG